MKTYRILIACGSGIATSTVIANRVKNLCESHGYKVNIQQVKIVQVESMARDFDLIVSSTRVPGHLATPSVFAVKYLTGIRTEDVDREILDKLSALAEAEKKEE